MRLHVGIVSGLMAAFATMAVAADQWSEYRYPDRGFAAQFPGVPALSVTAIGGTNPFGLYQYQSGAGKIAYVVSVDQYSAGLAPKNPGAAYFEAVANLYAKGSGSTFRSGQAATIAGRPGYEAITDDAAHDRHFLIDLTAAGDRVFMIVSVGPKGQETSADAKRFRDSFKVIQ